MFAIDEDYDFTVTNIRYIVERHSSPEWSVNYANEHHHILVFATAGKSRYDIEDKHYEIKEGDLLIFPKYLMHKGASDPIEPWSFYTVQFNLHFANALSEQRFSQIRPVIRSTNPFELNVLFQELYRTWSMKKQGYLIKCRGILLQLLYILIRENSLTSTNSPHYYTMEKLLNVMAADYPTTFTVQQLADLAGFSPSYLRALFKKMTGLTVIQYQQHIRISKARDLLLSGACNVTEAAQRVGFNDIFYFSKLFKKMIGINPSEYMNR
jgi:AraC-like DNA-binding protein